MGQSKYKEMLERERNDSKKVGREEPNKKTACKTWAEVVREGRKQDIAKGANGR